LLSIKADDLLFVGGLVGQSTWALSAPPTLISGESEGEFVDQLSDGFSVPERSVVFTERDQHGDREPLKPGVPRSARVRRTAWAPKAERPAACLPDC
jgi:hypothetical protein